MQKYKTGLVHEEVNIVKNELASKISDRIVDHVSVSRKQFAEAKARAHLSGYDPI
jgi:hypothetical protein